MVDVEISFTLNDRYFFIEFQQIFLKFVQVKKTAQIYLNGVESVESKGLRCNISADYEHKKESYSLLTCEWLLICLKV